MNHEALWWALSAGILLVVIVLWASRLGAL
jgi:hypothetical protein